MKTIFIDAGHGAIDPQTQTYLTSGKRFFHKDVAAHDGGWFYEGVKNREYTEEIIRLLTCRGAHVVPVYHEYLDTPLTNRVLLADTFHKYVQNGIYYSEHSNATPSHRARGLQVYTSPGKTKSDPIADMFYETYLEYKRRYPKLFEDVKFLTDTSDGDYDYEAKFTVLTQTDMPAVLVENLFFDNVEDVKLLLSKQYKTTYCYMVADWLWKAANA